MLPLQSCNTFCRCSHCNRCTDTGCTEKCFQCGGTLKIIAAIVDPTVIAKILTHLGLSARHLRYAVPAPLAGQPAPPCAGVRASVTRHSPTPIAGAVIQPIPHGLIPNRHPIRSQCSSDSFLFGNPPHPSDSYRFGKDSCLTTHEPFGTVPRGEKGRLFFLYLTGTGPLGERAARLRMCWFVRWLPGFRRHIGHKP